VRERATTFVDAADRLDFVFRDPPAIDAAAAAKFLGPASAPLLGDLAAELGAVEPWTVAAIEARVQAWLGRRGMQIKDVAQPARVALTGRTASPGLYEVIEALGKDRAIGRLTAAQSSPS
jgi:glutamyl-tRNA synthetase